MNNISIKRIRESITNLFELIANTLLPKDERVKFLEKLGPDGLFADIPRSENFDFETDKIKAIFNYKNTLCRQAIWEIKYRANKKMISDFSQLLYEFILEDLPDLRDFHNFQNIILLPTPSSPLRQKEKGFNQCVLICEELIRIDRERNGNNFTLVKDFLIKISDTKRQSHVSDRKTRLKNVINTFSINQSVRLGVRNSSLRLTQTNHSESFPDTQPAFPTDYSFIIIDDVITTGATMNEAFRALKTAGIPPRKIRGYALAH